MIQDLERIKYRRGMLEKGMRPEDLPANVWRGAEIPADVRFSTNAENPRNLGGVYGDKKAGDPMEYDNLNLVLTDSKPSGCRFSAIMQPNSGSWWN